MGILLAFTIVVTMTYLVGFMAGLLLGVIWVLLVEGLKRII